MDQPLKITADKAKLIKDVSSAVERIKKRMENNKRKKVIIVIFSAIGSALTTVLLGFSAYIKEYTIFFNVSAMTISGVTTVVASWDGLFDHKRLWIMQSEALNSFKELSEDMEHLERSGKLDQAAIDYCYLRYKEIYEKWNLDWKDLRFKE